MHNFRIALEVIFHARAEFSPSKVIVSPLHNLIPVFSLVTVFSISRQFCDRFIIVILFWSQVMSNSFFI